MNIQTLLETKVKEGFIILFETKIPSVEFQATRKILKEILLLLSFLCSGIRKETQFK